MTVRTLLAFFVLPVLTPALLPAQQAPAAVFGYTDFTTESKIEGEFLAVPDAKLAGQHLKTLTGTDHHTASRSDRRHDAIIATTTDKHGAPDA